MNKWIKKWNLLSIQCTKQNYFHQWNHFNLKYSDDGPSSLDIILWLLPSLRQ